jgi:pteridine reductase
MPNTDSTSSRVALITGASRRVGASIATALHQRGLNVVVHYRKSADDAQALAASLNTLRADSACAMNADLSDAQQAHALIEQTVQHFGALDVLVNNASSFYATPLEQVTAAQFDELMGANLKGPLFLSAAAAKELRPRGGAIINITDIHARHPLEQHAIYCATKAGLESLTRSLARELAPEVRVNAVAPGAILWPENTTADDEKTKIIDGTELKRLGAPKDIAGAVVYLALDAGYSTGQILSVDGGRTVGP